MNPLGNIRTRGRFFACLLLSTAIFVLDLKSKSTLLAMIETSMVEGKEFADGIVLSKFLNVVLVWNRGGCFGLLRNVQFISSLLLAVALGVALTLLFCLWRSTNALNSLCFALVLGGALGNARDRIVYGAVVDFIDLHLGKYHWPVFNVADSAICIGLVLYLAADMSGANGKERRL